MERFSAEYLISTDDFKNAGLIADEICIEDTVELNRGLISDDFTLRHLIGQTEGLAAEREGIFRARISYPCEIAVSGVPQLLNILFGNTSMKTGIRLEKIIPHPALVEKYKGPRFGVQGIRQILGVPDRPLLVTTLKHLGKSPGELAAIASQLAMGGVDIIKDDHTMTDDSFCPFEERVRLCAGAVTDANARTGKKTIYAPNIAGIENALYAVRNGAGGLEVLPFTCGPGILAELRSNPEINVPIFVHPSFSGSYMTCRKSGISPYFLLGQLPRLLGADAVIHPFSGGRFSLTTEDCMNIASGCLEASPGLKPVLPVPGGGISEQGISAAAAAYPSNDFGLLIGGTLYGRPGSLAENTGHFIKILESCPPRQPLNTK